MQSRVWLLLCTGCLFTAAAAAQQVTEKQLISTYLAGPTARAQAAGHTAARNEWRARAALDQPSVTYSREDAAGTRDQFVTVSQKLPVNGRLGALHRAGSAAVAEYQATFSRRVQLSVADLRTAFHAARAGQQRVEGLEKAAARTAEILRILRAREQDGDASGLERMRVEREHQALLHQLVRARTELLSARAVLESLTGVALDASLLVADVPEHLSDDPVAFALAHRADYLAKLAELQKQNALEQAASRSLIPEPTITVGSKSTAAGPLRDTGYIAAAAVEIPLFGRARAERARAVAEAHRAEAELVLLKNRIVAEVNAARRSLDLHRELARTAAPPQDDIAAIALASYNDGEASLLELLDAYRVTLDSHLRAVDLGYNLAAAQIAFDLATGRTLQP